MINTDHPYFFIKNLLDSESTYSLSRYTYLPDSLSDNRIIDTISGEDFSINYVNSILKSLNRDQELAFHSLVQTKSRRIYHIPMIDFSISRLDREVYYRLKNFIDYKILYDMSFYSTGNSFHAYSSKLLTHREWLKFMGSLLLVNPSNSSLNIIDNRWIGHRLMSGFSSLRWSNNSGIYKNLPKETTFNLL